MWTYDKEGIVQVQDTITSSDTSNANNPRTTVHSVYAKAAGTVTVTATPMDTTGGAEPIVFTVTVTEGGTEDSQLKAKAEKGIAHGQAYMTGSGVSAYSTVMNGPFFPSCVPADEFRPRSWKPTMPASARQ